jgi:energy-coupling factor transporter ATP-binding protein EcfA2
MWWPAGSGRWSAGTCALAAIILCAVAMPLREDLHNWFSRQPLWQQDLARRLASRTHLEAADYAEALGVVKGELGGLGEGESAPPARPLELEDLPASASTGAPRVTRFGRLRGVGAVSGEHELRFAPEGLTVIYGQNAVGKSTYVRALKRVCRTVDCDAQLRGNVFAPREVSEPDPTAKIELSSGGQSHAQQLNLADPPDLGLQAISVFDAQCAELYLDSQNAIAFVPAGLRLLARLAACQDHMRRDLEEEMRALAHRAPAFAEFTADTAVKRLLDGLAAETDLAEVTALATLAQEERERQAELRAVLASADARNARADAEGARQDARQGEALAAQLRELATRVGGPAREDLRERAARAASAEAAIELAAREFQDLPVKGIGSGPWRLLWQAARGFAEQTQSMFPPSRGEHCPLCLQEIPADVAARLSHFQEHVESSVQAEARVAREALASALDALDARHLDACRGPFLTGLREREPQLHDALDGYLTAIGERMRALCANPLKPEVLPLIMIAVESLEAWGKARGVHAEALLAADDPELEKALRSELAELDAREQLAGRSSDVEGWVRILKQVAALRGVHGALATNRITSKQRQLSEEVLTGELDTKLKLELGHLDCRNIPIDLHPETRVGETHLALRLAGVRGAPRVSEIASEGEQRALALSFFLAEIAMSDGDGGIIVDDPVSSLDDERRDYIARRLVAETEHRQVIVFTHDLPFMLDLLERAEEAGLEPLVQGVWRLGDEVGRVDDHPPFKAMKLKQRIGVLDQDVGQWDKQDPPRDFDEAWRRVCDFYARLRITWERGVEERLFKGVVTRLQREVKTRALQDVVITPELVALVTEAMTRCSLFVHDEPPAASTALPDRAQLGQELDKLREFMRLTR